MSIHLEKRMKARTLTVAVEILYLGFAWAMGDPTKAA
jgi:hypothetical protein